MGQSSLILYARLRNLSPGCETTTTCSCDIAAGLSVMLPLGSARRWLQKGGRGVWHADLVLPDESFPAHIVDAPRYETAPKKPAVSSSNCRGRAINHYWDIPVALLRGVKRQVWPGADFRSLHDRHRATTYIGLPTRRRLPGGRSRKAYICSAGKPVL